MDAHRPPDRWATSCRLKPVGAETIGTGDIRIILNALGTVTPLATSL